MQETSYYKLPLYEPNDVSSLIDGYNKAAAKIDVLLHELQNENDLLKMRVYSLEKKED